MIVLDHARLARIADLPLSLTLDLYPPTRADDAGTVTVSPPEQSSGSRTAAGQGHADEARPDSEAELYADLTGWRVVPAVRSASGLLAIRSSQLGRDEIAATFALGPLPPLTEDAPTRQLEAFSWLEHETETWIWKSGLPRSAALAMHWRPC
jgi:hypothetical protein